MTRASKCLKCFFDFSIENTLLVLALLFALGTAVIIWHLNQLSDSQIRSTAIQNSQILTEALATFRTLYTSEVVVAAQAGGIEVSHDYHTKENAIPLPATLTMLLGNHLGGRGDGVESRLYSPFPFPWRAASGGLSDNFAREAWQALQANPEKPFYRFELVNGRNSLRYAKADLMRESCIDCHNNHTDTPKSDWSTGQLRGVLEVIIPVDNQLALTNDMILQTLLLTTSVMLLSLVGIGLVMHRLRSRTKEAHELAETTTRINQNLAQEMEIRQQAESELLKLSLTDALTEIGNRRRFDAEFEREWKRALRSHTYLSLVMIDIDHFKLYNDNYGHQAGDRALHKVATAMKRVALRSTDLIARYGGEEFALLLPETDEKGALQIAEHVRSEVEDSAIPHGFSQNAEVVTVSVGVTTLIPDNSTSQADVIEDTDRALYAAKHAGRNCVRTSPRLVHAIN